MIQNALFARFAVEFTRQFSANPALIERMKLTEVTNGVALDLLDHDEAIQFRIALRAVASQVAEGRLTLTADADSCSYDSLRSAFANLVDLIDRNANR
jgi:hypothetical protein